MLSKFGQLVRALRLEKNLLMSEMAEKLEVSPSYLSAVEFGRRAVPEIWPKKISEILQLNSVTEKLLSDAAVMATSKSRGAVTMSLDELTPLQEEVAMIFAKGFKALSDDELKAIKDQFFEDKVSEQNWRHGSSR